MLRLLGTDLDGPDIARELVVSLNTVRTHTKNIYAKLGVNNRRAAVRRAEELDLLSRDPRPLSEGEPCGASRRGRSKITTLITTRGDARLTTSAPMLGTTPAADRRTGGREQMSGMSTHRPATVTRTAATRSASRDTWMPDGPPGSTD